MEIVWYGHSCFRIKDRTATVLTDPYDKSLGLALPRMRADIVTVSHDSPHHNAVHNVKPDFKVIDGPGEYEIGGTFVTGVQLYPPKNSSAPARNNVYVIYMENLAVCHMGDLHHIPTQSQVEGLGSIDILMIPVGGHKALSAAQAAEVISLIEPYIVIPMHYSLPEMTIELDPVSKFLKEMGIAKADPESAFKITKSTLPEETQVVLLEPKL
ncbi:MAG: MBL fold metallo-hydrolase [Anaerolineae bacterium]|nr:MBL fold metallo-hydrolase [Anaerolineae bacterium]